MANLNPDDIGSALDWCRWTALLDIWLGCRRRGDGRRALGRRDPVRLLAPSGVHIFLSSCTIAARR